MGAILSVRAIKRKVRSVSNIKKITRAMQMVSAAKLKKVQVRLMELRPYSDKIREFLQGLASQVKLFEKGLLEYLAAKHPGVGEKIRQSKKFEPETETALKGAIAEFKAQFTAQK